MGEKQNEDVKMLHNQHARILKEEDEFWISSEDLNTENSSEDEKSKAKQIYKRKIKSKHRKRSTPSINVQRPSVSSGSSAVADTSTVLDDRLLMPALDDLPSRSDESRTSDEEYMSISSELLSKRLSLDDWRPTRGSLKISSLEEAVADDTVPGKFYDVMLHKLRSLKSCSSLKSTRKVMFQEDEEEETSEGTMKTFKFLKRTPEVKNILGFIKKMDENISNTINQYKAERTERQQMEFEVCKYMSQNKFSPEKDSENFLQMCDFENKFKRFNEQAQKRELPVYHKAEEVDTNEAQEKEGEDGKLDESNQDKLSQDIKTDLISTNFIQKNVNGAKEGMMACYSLTDDQKRKIEDILKDIDDFQLDNAELSLSTFSAEENDQLEVENFEYIMNNSSVNAFVILDNEKVRMGEIDTELEKIALDKQDDENKSSEVNVTMVKDEEYWKQYILDTTLNDIDKKLEKLHETYLEDDVKLANFSVNDSELI